MTAHALLPVKLPPMSLDARAACRGHDPQLWFPADNRQTQEAKRICGHCPLRQQCADWAIRTGEPFGIWGGLTPVERGHRTSSWRRSRRLYLAARGVHTDTAQEG